MSQAATLAEDFATDPLTRGWRVFGDANLFAWNAANHNLSVTWDSSRPNSYYYLPLGTILNRQDDFSLALDLKLIDVAAGVNANKPSTFELALGFLNLAESTGTNFFRGNSSRSPDLVEFDFFPDTEFGPTIWPSIWSTNSSLNYNGSGDYSILALPTLTWMRVSLSYTTSNATLAISVKTNGVSIGTINSVKLSPSFTDFRAAAFGIESYSDAGQDPRFGGSLLAHGIVDNILLTVPPPPIVNVSGHFTNGRWEVMFGTRANWLYTLERTLDFQTWASASPATAGNGTNLVLSDPAVMPGGAFYRVRAEKP